MARDRVGDADAADQQRGQGDQRQELAETLDIAFELRRGLAARADIPAGIRESAPRRLLDRRHWRRRSRRDRGSRSRYCQRTRLPGWSRPLARSAASLMRRRGPKPMPPASLSGSLLSTARSSIVALPIADAVAGLEIEPRQQRRIDRGAEGVALPLQTTSGGGMAGFVRDCSEQRIGAVNGLDLDQRRPPVIGRAPWSAASRPPRLHRARRETPLLAARLALDQREGKIAAEDHAAGAGEAVGEALAPPSRRRRSP